jgi:beta-glucosidase
MFNCTVINAQIASDDPSEKKINELIGQMTLEEKIGQMSQFNGFGENIPDHFKTKIRQGLVGSVLNEVNISSVNSMQKIAVEESRLGIPVIFGRDVIHGFKTIFPIPLGQAASWNPEIIRECARVSALEARKAGVNWTFAPMVDITRDPRWGRVAEGFGEDPYLASVLALAMMEGFQGDRLSDGRSLAACAKHFAGYGAAEGGRDYNTTAIPENDLRDIYLKPFETLVHSGVATLMAAFNEINGVPATGNELILKRILRNEWGFRGFVVSDWASVEQLTIHGFAENKKEAARIAIQAGVDMEMATTTYADHVKELITEGSLDIKIIDQAVKNILRIKMNLGLFDQPYTNPDDFPEWLNADHKELARKAAVQTTVLLKNKDDILPLSVEKIRNIAVVGPLANDPHDQLGTWIPDGDKNGSTTPLKSVSDLFGDGEKVHYARGLKLSRTKDHSGFKDAVQAASKADIVLLFLGEESILSGEAHCRADIGLPGAQEALVYEIAKVDKPVVAVIMAGRPLTIRPILDQVDAALYAWHPGTMAGPAITDIIFGKENPSAKLPVTFPTSVGQIPIYYAYKNTGKPATMKSWVKLDDIPAGTTYIPGGFTNHYLDEGFEPLFHFGYGLSYTSFEYSAIDCSSDQLTPHGVMTVSADVKNTGKRAGTEISQLYVRDVVGDRTRPVRELKGFQRITLNPGEKKRVFFDLRAEDLSFTNRAMIRTPEAGLFKVWIGGSSQADLTTEFYLKLD